MGSPHSTIWLWPSEPCDIMTIEYLYDDSIAQKGFPFHFTDAIDFVSKPTDKSPKRIPSVYPKHESIPWSFIGTFIFTTGCLLSYYLTVHQYQRFPEWYYVPMISFCGCYPEEQPLWRATFIFAAIGQLMAQYTITDTALYHHFLKHSPSLLSKWSRYLLTIHAFASMLVGVFPLTPAQCQESVVLVDEILLDPQLEVEHMVDASAIPHYVSALFAAGPGVVGVILGIISYFYALQAVEGTVNQCTDQMVTVLKRFFVFKVVCATLMCLGCVGICIIGPVMVLWTGYVTKNMANFISFAEWVLCIPMGLCDGCYSLENYYVVESLRRREEQRIRNRKSA